ncbi:tRNA-His guanylyltransferase [Halocaridina rubra]|uniref:Probable tRNA(His) guanylyltransferase n=1 Tax=Halocaridina rubra TaxID=373956 RepID=A0AAN8ZUT0_HALRR
MEYLFVVKSHVTRALKQLLHQKRRFQSSTKMAKSKFEYVKSFETEDRLDPGHCIIIALRCSNFQSIVENHGFKRPNDNRFIKLMEDATKDVMGDFKDLKVGYTFADQCNLVFPKNVTIYRRRGPKLLTNLCSLLATTFVHKWPMHFEVPLDLTPIIEGTIYLLPNYQGLRDFLTEQQLQCHYRNLYETVLWSLVNVTGISYSEAAETLEGTNEGEKNEILFSRCNMNYNKECDAFKKGSIVVRKLVPTEVTTPEGSTALRNASRLIVLYTDFSKDCFWKTVLSCEENTKLNSKRNYFKDLERNTKLLPHTWIVVRIDGKGFHKFSDKHNFTKPNDIRSINLMNCAAQKVMAEYPDIIFSYGQSDEYTFVTERYSRMLDRNSNKIMSTIVSLFAATYVYNWNKVFKGTSLKYCPAFDARVVLYPNISSLRDYLSWRQADCHINNMYNLCFWMLVQKRDLSHQEAEERLCGTFSNDKRALLLSEFQCEYDEEEAIYRKGTILHRKNPEECVESLSLSRNETLYSFRGNEESSLLGNLKCASDIITVHVDMINDTFWSERPWILGNERDAKTLEDLDE